MTRTLGRRILIVLLVALVAAPGRAATDELDPASDVAVKAAFLYNFAKFTEWQSLGANAPLVLCVIGSPQIAKALIETVRGQRIGAHQLDVIAQGSDGALRSCQVLFVSTNEMRKATAALEGLKVLPILTVSDGNGFAQSKGVIEFFMESGRMRFAINTDAADRAGLRLSSRLLGLAKIIRNEPVQ